MGDARGSQKRSKTWDSWKDTLTTYGPLAIPREPQVPLCAPLSGQPAPTPLFRRELLPAPIAGRCITLPPGMRQAPTVPCCWPPLSDMADKRREMVSEKVFVLEKPSAGPWPDEGRRGRSGPLRRDRGVLAPCCPGKAPGAPALLPAATGK